jgi:transcriptional regulator with XRE-family HTH domain
MDFFFMNDEAVCKEIGRRLKTNRLNKNWTQKEVADFSGISVTAVKSVESGKGTILSLVKILRALKSLDSLNAFLPDPGFSPRQIAKLKGKPRTRATGRNKKGQDS